MRNCLLTILLLCIATFARAQTTEPALAPASMPAYVDLSGVIDVSPLRNLSVQDNQTLKTWDTFARQKLGVITGRSKYEGQEPIFTILDMAVRPEHYVDRNIIKVKSVPLRQDLAAIIAPTDPKEAERVRVQGLISLAFWKQLEHNGKLAEIQNGGVFKSQAIGEVADAVSTLEALPEWFQSGRLAIIPPVSKADSGRWRSLLDVGGNVPAFAESQRQGGRVVPARVDGFDDAQLERVFGSFGGMLVHWASGDARTTQSDIANLVDALPRVQPTMYPSELKRNAEVVYNRFFQLTLPGAFLYFVAFSAFLVAARTSSRGIHRVAVISMAAALLLHTTGVVVRWWLVEKSTDDWFHSIPIKNQFESVMMAAWFGGIVGLLLEVGAIQRVARTLTGLKFFGGAGKNFYGAACSFVGFLALVALFTVPYVFGKEIGGQIGQVNGILMSYWLYIHVTLATFSYALIGMSFLLGVWWLVKYLANFDEVSAISNPRQLSADAVDESDDDDDVDGGGGAAVAVAVAKPQAAMRVSSAPSVLARLDACNLVVLQLAFWILGTAIVCGAVWADVSWGRPWGWDPKETFALVTWIVYLIVVHMRFATKHKALWTAVLSVLGFFVMLFNWIGVNYFLVGLHSYA
ncbi:MAG: cytochrome c biogenesis protein CcsA [Tepidisphaeraceae bacterium]